MKKQFGIRIKLIFVVIPVVLVIIFSFFALSRRMLIRQAKENLVSESLVHTSEISAWADSILKEIAVYVDTINSGVFADDNEILRYMETSLGRNASYPVGLYMGDNGGTYLDASGWMPDDEWVLVERDWYLEGKEHETVAFGEPYYDSQTGQVCVSASVKMDNPDVCRVLAADIYLDYVSSLMSGITIGNSGKAFLVAKSSQTMIAHPDESMININLEDKGIDSFYYNVGEKLQSGSTGLNEIQSDKETYFVCIHNIRQTDWCLVTYISRDDVLSGLRQLQAIMFCIALVAALVLVATIICMMNQVVKPVQQVTDVLSEVAAGDFSKNTVLAGRARNDEIAGMSNSMQMFLEKMRGIISGISDTAEWLNQQAQENRTVSKSLKASADEQADAMVALDDMVQELSSTANQAAEGMEGLVDIIRQTRSEGADAGAVMQETVRASEDGHAAMKKIQASMGWIEETMESLETQIRQTEDAVSQVGNMVSLIMDIADETDLLALNASIEAAGAGEAGRGFTVVAEQVGRLAANSSIAAGDISKLTVSIKETVARAASHMEQGTGRVKESILMVESTVQTFERVFSQVGETDVIIGRMLALVDKVDSVASGMMEIAKEQLNVTGQITHSTGQLDEYTKTVNSNSESVAESAEELEKQSGKLSESMNQFRV